MDIIDAANETCEQFLAGEIARARRRMADEDTGARECENCGCVIPVKRRLAVPGCVYCVGCQMEMEELERKHG